MIIYRIYTDKGLECYIGKTINMHRRWIDHRKPSSRKTMARIIFDKYEKENCIYEILEECDDEVGEEREIWWINQYPNCVNRNTASSKSIEYNQKEKMKEYYRKRSLEKVSCNICEKLISRGNMTSHTRNNH